MCNESDRNASCETREMVSAWRLLSSARGWGVGRGMRSRSGSSRSEVSSAGRQALFMLRERSRRVRAWLAMWDEIAAWAVISLQYLGQQNKPLPTSNHPTIGNEPRAASLQTALRPQLLQSFHQPRHHPCQLPRPVGLLLQRMPAP